MKQFRSKGLARTGLMVLAAGALVFVTYGGQAYARDGQAQAQSQTTVTAQTTEADTTTQTDTQTQTAINSRLEQAQQRLQAEREQAKAKLDAARLKVCEARQKGITERMSTMVTTSTNHLTVFSDIAARVEAFYTSKARLWQITMRSLLMSTPKKRLPKQQSRTLRQAARHSLVLTPTQAWLRSNSRMRTQLS